MMPQKHTKSTVIFHQKVGNDGKEPPVSAYFRINAMFSCAFPRFFNGVARTMTHVDVSYIWDGIVHPIAQKSTSTTLQVLVPQGGAPVCKLENTIPINIHELVRYISPLNRIVIGHYIGLIISQLS